MNVDVTNSESGLLLGQGSRFTAELAEQYQKLNLWRDAPLGEYLTRACENTPDRMAAVSVSATGVVTKELTYRELDDLSRRISTGLQRLGVSAGDTVSVMVPNCAEFSALVFAVARLGARYSGIPITYGRREVEFMLRRASSKILVIADKYGDEDLVGMMKELRDAAPELQHIIVVGEEVTMDERGWSLFSELRSEIPLSTLPDVEAFSIAQLAFTSGTTSEPKAVMNLHVTIDAVISNWVDHVGVESLGSPLVNLIMSPVGHSTGFFWGALMTAHVGGTAVYLNRWRPELGLQVLREQRITTMIGSPTFLLDILRLESATAEQLPDLRFIAVPGAPIPRALIAKARKQLDCHVIPAWGMTEYGIGVSGSPKLERDRVEATDGLPVRGCEVRICDLTDKDLGVGREGELQIRGAGLFAGYFGRPDYTADSFTPEGWFRTGDRAVIEDDGFVSLKGRTKDIVIRGGENIPVIDIENLLYKHPSIAEVAIVGIPDERLGERACLAMVLKEGAAKLDLSAISAFLLNEGISKRFLPEVLIELNEMPKTMSGKIRKLELREMLERS